MKIHKILHFGARKIIVLLDRFIARYIFNLFLIIFYYLICLGGLLGLFGLLGLLGLFGLFGLFGLLGLRSILYPIA